MKPVNTPTTTPVFELKGSVLTVIVLHLKEIDADRLYVQLEKKIGQARSFFNNAPVLIDLSSVDEESQESLDFMFLVTTLRKFGLIPVGVRGSAAGQIDRVLQAGLGLLPAIKTEKTVEAYTDQSSEPGSRKKEKTPQPSESVAGQEHTGASTKVVSLPVRSGQQVVASEGDLVILSSVNAGAEVLAAGNIHVYGALRGRAMAGINGNAKARIFSLQCNPELVAIAGEYMVNESLKPSLINQSVIVSLEEGALKFEVVGSFNPVP